MKAFSLPDFPDNKLFKGAIPESQPFVLAESLLSNNESVRIVFFPSMKELNRSIHAIKTFYHHSQPKSDEVHKWGILPPPIEDTAEDPLPERVAEEIECDRSNALTLLSEFADKYSKYNYLNILTTPDGFFAEVPARESLKGHELRLTRGDNVDFNSLKASLSETLDYDSEAVCERPGQYAVRGGLIDLYPVNASAPVRLDFFGDEIESIRLFDPTTQRTISETDSVKVAARNSVNLKYEKDGILDYLAGPVHWLFMNPGAIESASPDRFQQFERINDQRCTFHRLFQERTPAHNRLTGITDLEPDAGFFASCPKQVDLKISSLDNWREHPLENTIGLERLEAEKEARSNFYKQLNLWKDEKVELTAFVPDAGKLEEIRHLFKESKFDESTLNFKFGEISAGFIVTEKQLLPISQRKGSPSAIAIITPRELIGRHPERRPAIRQRLLPHRSHVDQLLDFSDLANGDPLVHLAHGICLFRGLSKMEMGGRLEDTISLEFADKVTLHISLKDAHLLTRYVGLSKTNPKLGKIGSGNWEKSRALAEKATLDFAAELLNLQAAREEDSGIAFSMDNEWQLSFENAFPYSETPDQLKAIIDTKSDMQKERPMDRLICGDVGFGKTEVAIRAALKAVLDNYQVAILVPTTILAQQHYETFRERFAPYPVSIEMLSRFRDRGQQKKITEQLKNGHIDVIIGTHRLISKDVSFKNLGLLVIDEEHRFGVRHKEQIKQMRLEVDVLTMSATPIPRTLYLALMGARDLSVIETPPANRLPIETIVRGYDNKLVKSAIERELERGGQVFYLHNRVQSIHSVADKLEELVPSAKIAVGHGQMTEHALEKIMTEFVRGDHDILVCTTIIENGLDIPNCNTIIIEGADRFGLSQLYQLRGRVGRFNRQAYAYLLLHRHSKMLDLSRKRLSAMRQHNQLGAGFKIAMRDLELRGAGNLLGQQQSGHIASVGFDLYCQLLRQSIQRIKGEDQAERIRASVQLDFILNSGGSSKAAGSEPFSALVEEELESYRISPMEASLPNSFIDETRLRIDFYRRLALANSLEEVELISSDLSDRFGRLPEETKRLIQISKIRVSAEIKGIQSIESTGNRLKCKLAASGKREFIKQSGRFPRLSSRSADRRLEEILSFVQRFNTPKSMKN